MAHELNVALLSGYSGTSVEARLFVAGTLAATVELTEIGTDAVFSNAADLPTLVPGRYLVKYSDTSGNYLAQGQLDWSGSVVAQNVSHINWEPVNMLDEAAVDAEAVAIAILSKKPSDLADAPETLGAGLAAVIGGGAYRSVDIYCLDSSNRPIPNASLRVTDDEAGDTVRYRGNVDEAGKVTVFLRPGNYWVWGQHPTARIPSPRLLTVSAA
jgi:hypothetical protein